jgi:murein L,D-transpeptidase YafK
LNCPYKPILVAVLVFTIGPARAEQLSLRAATQDPIAKADRVVIDKSARVLRLLRDGRILRSYRVALGREPLGPKTREGDGRTPEGSYLIDWRNLKSKFHRSLHISYPRPEDTAQAEAIGVSPGGMIMIHGLPNGFSAAAVGHPADDWTDGCIAVSNAEIEEIWRSVDDGTPVLIEP